MRKKTQDSQESEIIRSKNSKSSPEREPANKKKSSESEDIDQIPKRLQQSYQELKQSQHSLSNTASFSQNNKALLYLKELYMREQSIIVKGIKEMSQQSKNIIEDLNNIEGQIDKYQTHIDEWINKIRQLSANVQKIQSVEGSFRKKAVNMAKLKDFLNVQKPRRR